MRVYAVVSKMGDEAELFVERREAELMVETGTATSPIAPASCTSSWSNSRPQ